MWKKSKTDKFKKLKDFLHFLQFFHRDINSTKRGFQDEIV